MRIAAGHAQPQSPRAGNKAYRRNEPAGRARADSRPWHGAIAVLVGVGLGNFLLVGCIIGDAAEIRKHEYWSTQMSGSFMSSMLPQLVIATVMVFATMMIHLVGVTTLARLLRFDPTAVEHHHRFTPRVALLVLGIVLALVFVHGVEIWLYAGLYLYLGAVADLETAVYFSTMTYAAIGFGDSEMARQWRLVSAIEGVNGVLLLGWSTAFFVSVVARLRR